MNKKRAVKNTNVSGSSVLKSGAGSKGLLASGIVARARPINPAEKIRETLVENQIYGISGDWIRFSNGSDQLLADLAQLFFNSPTSKSIIEKKVTMCVGSGISAAVGRPLSVLSSSVDRVAVDELVLPDLDMVLCEVNESGETIIDVLSEGLMDYEVFGNAFFVLSKTPDTVFAQAAPMKNTRLSVKKKGLPQFIGINPRPETNTTWEGEEVQRVTLWPTWTQDPAEPEVQRTAIHIKHNTPTFRHYGLPPRIACTMAEWLEYGILEHNASRVQRRNVPSGVLQLFGAYSTEEAKQVVSDSKKKFGETGSNDGLLIQVLSDASMAAKFTPMSNDAEGNYTELYKIVKESILTAQQWQPSLAGFAAPGKLGNMQQAKLEFEIVQSTVIEPIQRRFERLFFARFMEVLSEVRSEFKGIHLSIQSVTPASFLAGMGIGNALTTDEIREEAGFGATDENTEDGYANN